jgi:hypothetical protein
MPRMKYNIPQQRDQDKFEYHRHIAQTGKPTRHLHQTLTQTFELLDLLQDNETEVLAETLAERMSELSPNLREEALGIQTMLFIADLHSSMGIPFRPRGNLRSHSTTFRLDCPL